jgi:hypothetical protein
MHNDFASGPDRDHDFTQLRSTKGGFIIAVEVATVGRIKNNVWIQDSATELTEDPPSSAS